MLYAPGCTPVIGHDCTPARVAAPSRTVRAAPPEWDSVVATDGPSTQIRFGACRRISAASACIPVNPGRGQAAPPSCQHAHEPRLGSLNASKITSGSRAYIGATVRQNVLDASVGIGSLVGSHSAWSLITTARRRLSA